MNRFWLKITAGVVLTLVVIAGVYAFWPAKTKPLAESKYTVHLQKEEKRVLQAGPEMAHHDEVYLKDSQVRKLRSKPPKWDQKNYFTDTEIGLRYPDNLQTQKSSRQLPKGRYYRRHPGAADSEKAGKPPAEPPQWQPGQFNTKDRARSLVFLKSLRSKKPVEQRRPGPPEGAELKISEEQMKKLNETALQHILEEYKDNPKQAEQIRKILLERLKHFQEQSDAANKEISGKK